MNITTNLLTPNPQSRPQTPLKTIDAIVVHYVGNPNSTAVANRNYFDNLRTTKATYASSHYIVGLDGEIIQCVPENEVAYTSNSANSHTLGIEFCHPDTTGKLNEKTRQSLIELLADICKRYKLEPTVQIVRHFDVTGKMCPLWYVKNEGDWIRLKQDVSKMMEKPKEPKVTVEEIIMQVNGERKNVRRILLEGRNFVELNTLKELDLLAVSYDKKNNLVSLGRK